MRWELPPIIKVYEALGAIADKRIEVKGGTAIVVSSSGDKRYEVRYDPESRAISANDNGSYWQGYLGYPSIAFLMRKGILSFDGAIATSLKEIEWKKINTRFKNNFEKTESFVLEVAEKRGVPREKITAFTEKIINEIRELGPEKFGATKKPPRGS